MAESFFDSMHTLKDGAKNGEADVKLSTGVRDSYVNAVHDFRTVIEEQRKKVEGLAAYGDPGGFVSAGQTKTNLENARDELKRVLNDYEKYLDEFADTVKEAASRLIASG